MKNLLAILTFLLLTAGFLSCESDNNDPSPAGTLTVTATYTGTEAPVADPPATKEIYVYIYDESLSNTDTSRGFVASARTGAAVDITGITEYTLTIDNITPGNYKVAAFYDYKGGDNLDNQTDRFIFNDNKTSPDAADIVTIEDGVTTELEMDILDTPRLVSQSYFVTQTK